MKHCLSNSQQPQLSVDFVAITTSYLCPLPKTKSHFSTRLLSTTKRKLPYVATTPIIVYNSCFLFALMA